MQQEHLPRVPVSLPVLVLSLLFFQLLSEGAIEQIASSWFPTAKHGSATFKYS
jgi:hypothetical protein